MYTGLVPGHLAIQQPGDLEIASYNLSKSISSSSLTPATLYISTT